MYQIESFDETSEEEDAILALKWICEEFDSLRATENDRSFAESTIKDIASWGMWMYGACQVLYNKGAKLLRWMHARVPLKQEQPPIEQYFNNESPSTQSPSPDEAVEDIKPKEDCHSLV